MFVFRTVLRQSHRDKPRPLPVLALQPAHNPLSHLARVAHATRAQAALVCPVEVQVVAMVAGAPAMLRNRFLCKEKSKMDIT